MIAKTKMYIFFPLLVLWAIVMATLLGGAPTETASAQANPTLVTPQSTVLTRTRTPTLTPTPTRTGGICAPAVLVAAPFAYNGAGTRCFRIAQMSAFNSWNLSALSINGVNFTNMYVTNPSLFPPKINGSWYITYVSDVSWGHFEAQP